MNRNRLYPRVCLRNRLHHTNDSISLYSTFLLSLRYSTARAIIAQPVGALCRVTQQGTGVRVRSVLYCVSPPWLPPTPALHFRYRRAARYKKYLMSLCWLGDAGGDPGQLNRPWRILPGPAAGVNSGHIGYRTYIPGPCCPVLRRPRYYRAWPQILSHLLWC